MKITVERGRVLVRPETLENPALYGAAHALIASAYVVLLEEGGGALALRPKRGNDLRGLARAFAREYAEQARSWRVALLNIGPRRELLERMLAQSAGTGAGQRDRLSREQAARIAELLAEGPPSDPLGVGTVWSLARRRTA
ncbi:MAG TPA: hypothetical protein VNI01_01570 [Elusimicrobiota bacterium]|nr:hypothetical protein [Elusimicrobiota bacterium]